MSNRLSLIRNCYYHIRACRPSQKAVRRRLYRWIAEEKDALIASGADPEELRLWCRWLSRPAQESALRRLHTYRQDKQALGLALSLPADVLPTDE